MECEYQVEIDYKCLGVLAHHFPNAKRFGDIRDFHGQRDSVDIICGGFPCQNLSIAGRREGLAGEQSGLWYEFHRVVKEALPRWVVVENVPGLLSSNKGKDFAIILRGLVELGYGVCWRILDAKYFGVAQRRRRVFIVGNLRDGSASKVLFESEGMSWDSEKGGKADESLTAEVAASLRSGGNGKRGWIGDNEQGLTTIAPTLNHSGAATERPGGQGAEPEFYIAYPLRAGRRIADSGGNEGNIIAFDAQAAGSRRTFIHRKNGKAQLSGRADSDDNYIVAPTLDVGYYQKRYNNRQFFSQSGDGFPITQSEVRRLTPVECCRLQGFPDDWLDDLGLSDSAKYRMLGNAVAVPVAEWIGRRLMALV